MSKRRRIPSLPPDAAEKLLKDQKLQELFELSQLSTEAYDLVKNAILLNGVQGEFDVRFGMTTTVVLHLRGTGLGWVFYGNRNQERFKLENFGKKTWKLNNDIDGTTMCIEYCQVSEYDYECKLNSMEEVLKLIEYISDLFNASNRSLEFDERGYDYTPEHSSSKLEYLEAIQSTEVLKKCRKLSINGGTVSHDEMRRLLDGWTEGVKRMRIWCHPEPNFQYDRIISVPSLCIFGGTWFKGPMLLKLDCREVIVVTWILANEDINTWLHQWVSSSCKKLERLDIYIQFADMEFRNFYEDTWRCREVMEEQALVMDKITDGLSDYAINEPDLYERKFRRETDGRMIQANISESFFQSPSQFNYFINFTCSD